MAHYREIAGAVAGILSLAGYIPYLLGVIRGTTRPNLASWIIWTLVGGLLAVSFIAKGDFHAIWLPLGYFFGPLVTAIFALRCGYMAWSRMDSICMSIAAVSVLPWILSQYMSLPQLWSGFAGLDAAGLTLVLNLLIDAAGAVPTVIKSWQEPETEDFTAWTVFFIANMLELSAVQTWNISAVYPVYLVLLAGSIFLFTLRGKINRKQETRNGK